MCGRYHLEVNSLYEEDIEKEENFEYKNNFNITPQSKVPLVIDDKLKIATLGIFPRVVKNSKKFKTTF
jgi:putative SOS response-associated peptidase YedK